MNRWPSKLINLTTNKEKAEKGSEETEKVNIWQWYEESVASQESGGGWEKKRFKNKFARFLFCSTRRCTAPAILRIYVATVAHPSTVHILYSKEIRFCIIGCTQLAVAELMFSCWWWLATGKLLNWTRPGFKFAENASKYSSNSATSTTTSSTSTLGEVNKTTLSICPHDHFGHTINPHFSPLT